MNLTWKHLPAMALAAGSLIVATSAYAATITFGLQDAVVNGGAISFEGSSTSSPFIQGPMTYGTFSGITISASGPTGLDLLDTQTLNATAGSAGVLEIYVTEQGLSSPIGSTDFVSSLTTNVLSGLIASVQEQTFFDQGNGLFALGTPLSSMVFTSIGTKVQTQFVPNVVGPYSLTELYTITATGAGNSNDTIDIHSNPVPEPASLVLLGTGLFALTGTARRRWARK